MFCGYGIEVSITNVQQYYNAHDKGQTETGMHYHNIPKRIIPLYVDSAKLNGIKLSTIDKPKIKFSLWDGVPSNEPI